MSQSYCFKPLGAASATPAANATLAVTSSVQQVNLPQPNLGIGTMRIVVDGTSKIAWCYGTNANLTMSNGIVMLPNTVEVFDLPPGYTTLSVIGAASGSNINVTVGDGV